MTTNEIKHSLGTWKRGEAQIRVSYLDETHVRIDYLGANDSQVITADEWAARWDMMRDCGLIRVSY